MFEFFMKLAEAAANGSWPASIALCAASVSAGAVVVVLIRTLFTR